MWAVWRNADATLGTVCTTLAVALWVIVGLRGVVIATSARIPGNLRPLVTRPVSCLTRGAVGNPTGALGPTCSPSALRLRPRRIRDPRSSALQALNRLFR